MLVSVGNGSCQPCRLTDSLYLVRAVQHECSWHDPSQREEQIVTKGSLVSDRDKQSNSRRLSDGNVCRSQIKTSSRREPSATAGSLKEVKASRLFSSLLTPSPVRGICLQLA